MNHFIIDVNDSDSAVKSSSHNKWVSFNVTRPACSVKRLLLITKAHRHTYIASMKLCCFLFHGNYIIYIYIECVPLLTLGRSYHNQLNQQINLLKCGRNLFYYLSAGSNCFLCLPSSRLCPYSWSSDKNKSSLLRWNMW